MVPFFHIFWFVASQYTPLWVLDETEALFPCVRPLFVFSFPANPFLWFGIANLSFSWWFLAREVLGYHWNLPGCSKHMLLKDGKKSRFLATLNNIYFWHARMICHRLISVPSSFQLNWNFQTPELTIFCEFAAFFQIYGSNDHKQDFQSLSMAPDGL